MMVYNGELPVFNCDLTYSFTSARIERLAALEPDIVKFGKALIFETHLKSLLYFGDYLMVSDIPSGVELVDDPMGQDNDGGLRYAAEHYPALAAVFFLVDALSGQTSRVSLWEDYAEAVQKALEDSYRARLAALTDFSCGKAFINLQAMRVLSNDCLAYLPANFHEVSNTLIAEALTNSLRIHARKLEKMIAEVIPEEYRSASSTAS